MWQLRIIARCRDCPYYDAHTKFEVTQLIYCRHGFITADTFRYAVTLTSSRRGMKTRVTM